MHLWSCTIPFGLALLIAKRSLSVPLDVNFLEPSEPHTDLEADRERILAAKNHANINIHKMEYVLNHPTLEGHSDMIDAAFGTDPSRNMEKIKKTVQDLKGGSIPVHPEKEDIDSLGYTSYDDEMNPTHITFTKKFHSPKASEDQRSATLIHEATHFLSNTGDYIIENQILPGNDRRTHKDTGYSKLKEPAKTVHELNADTKWEKMRDGYKPLYSEAVPPTRNLHDNAESYAQFSSLCGAAISDQVVGFRRALIEGDFETAEGIAAKKLEMTKTYGSKSKSMLSMKHTAHMHRSAAGQANAHSNSKGKRQSPQTPSTSKGKTRQPGRAEVKRRVINTSRSKFGRPVVKRPKGQRRVHAKTSEKKGSGKKP